MSLNHNGLLKSMGPDPSERALIAVALEHQPLKPERILQSQLDFENKISSFDEAIRPLFVAYATVQALHPATQTTGFPVTKLIKNSKLGPNFDREKIRARIVKLYLGIARNVGIRTLKKERSKIARNADNLRLCQVASGKDYLLPIVFLQFRSAFGYPRGDEHFKVALARGFDSASEPYLARRLRNIAA